MTSEKELVQVDASNISLDRSRITPQRQIELPKSACRDNDGPNQYEAEARPPSQLVASLKEHKHHAAVKIRQKLHISKVSDVVHSEPSLLAPSYDEPSDSRLVHQLPLPDKPTIKDFIHHPTEVIKSKISDQSNHQVAAHIAAKEIPHGEEVDLINAHDAISRATTESERLAAIQDAERLMQERQHTYARWSLDRHITKLRVLPNESMARKSQVEFQRKNDHGQLQTDWKAYGRHVSEAYSYSISIRLTNLVACLLFSHVWWAICRLWI